MANAGIQGGTALWGVMEGLLSSMECGQTTSPSTRVTHIFGTYLDLAGEHRIVFPRARWETVELASVSLVREVERRVESEVATLPTVEFLSRNHKSLPAGLLLPSPGEVAKGLIFIFP